MKKFLLRGYIEWENKTSFIQDQNQKSFIQGQIQFFQRRRIYPQARTPYPEWQKRPVKEQFPPEVKEKRRKLYPSMQMAKRENKRVKLWQTVHRLWTTWTKWYPRIRNTSHTRNFLTRRIPGNASDTPWTLWASGARRGNNPTPTLRRNKRDGFKEIVDTKKIAQVGGPEVTTYFHKDP